MGHVEFPVLNLLLYEAMSCAHWLLLFFSGPTQAFPIPIGSMYGIFTYIYKYHQKQPNLGKYTSPMDPMGIWMVGSPYNPVGMCS